MRIAVTADPYIAIPPRHYGGIERVVDFLVRGLLARGHDVTLFAHPESSTDGKLIPYGAPPHDSVLSRARELWQVGSKLFARRGAFDVVHSFGRLAALAPILPLRSLAKLQTYQRALPAERRIARAVAMAGPSLCFTACGSHMYRGRSIAGEWVTVFNGVDLGKYAVVEETAVDAPLVFLGRIERIKGVHNAIAIARGAGRRLTIAGNVADGRYFDDVVAPEIDDDAVRYVGPVDDEQKSELLGRGAALLMAIEWDEPFGIVMAEAMACGTPVIGFDRGSVGEVVKDGVNGFVVSDVDGAIRAVATLDTLSRAEIRRDAEERFSADVVVASYVTLYERMLSGRG